MSEAEDKAIESLTKSIQEEPPISNTPLRYFIGEREVSREEFYNTYPGNQPIELGSSGYFLPLQANLSKHFRYSPSAQNTQDRINLAFLVPSLWEKLRFF